MQATGPQSHQGLCGNIYLIMKTLALPRASCLVPEGFLISRLHDSQFPVFECEYNNIDEELHSYLMDEMNSRTALTGAHKSIYVCCPPPYSKPLQLNFPGFGGEIC